MIESACLPCMQLLMYIFYIIYQSIFYHNQIFWFAYSIAFNCLYNASKFYFPFRIELVSNLQIPFVLRLDYLKLEFYFFSSPTPDQRRDVCRAIITAYSFLADAGGGYVS